MSGKTEWEDALIKHGIMEKPVEVPTDDDIVLRNFQTTEKIISELENKTEDDFLENYRKKRLAELKSAAEKNIFGGVTQINKSDFVSEVTETSKKHSVLCLLFMNGQEKSNILINALKIFSQKYRFIKCVSIIAQDCIENYPQSRSPMLLVYQNGDVSNTMFTGLNGINRKLYSKMDKIFEYQMKKIKIINPENELTNPEDEEESQRKLYFKPIMNNSDF